MERALLEGDIHVAVDPELEGDDQKKSTEGCAAVGFLHPPLNQNWVHRFWYWLVRSHQAALSYFRPKEDENDGNSKVGNIQDGF